jgi:hypothetical protein
MLLFHQYCDWLEFVIQSLLQKMVHPSNTKSSRSWHQIKSVSDKSPTRSAQTSCNLDRFPVLFPHPKVVWNTWLNHIRQSGVSQGKQGYTRIILDANADMESVKRTPTNDNAHLMQRPDTNEGELNTDAKTRKRMCNFEWQGYRVP